MKMYFLYENVFFVRKIYFCMNVRRCVAFAGSSAPQKKESAASLPPFPTRPSRTAGLSAFHGSGAWIRHRSEEGRHVQLGRGPREHPNNRNENCEPRRSGHQSSGNTRARTYADHFDDWDDSR